MWRKMASTHHHRPKSRWGQPKTQFVVISPPQTRFDGMHSFHDVLVNSSYAHSIVDDLQREVPVGPEDNATIIFTSGAHHIVTLKGPPPPL